MLLAAASSSSSSSSSSPLTRLSRGLRRLPSLVLAGRRLGVLPQLDERDPGDGRQLGQARVVERGRLVTGVAARDLENLREEDSQDIFSLAISMIATFPCPSLGQLGEVNVSPSSVSASSGDSLKHSETQINYS